jgi:colanic acid/amylovoran biosynthesis protein
MIVEIHGAGFQNKGAELMLNTVVGELEQRLPKIDFVINPHFGDFKDRCNLSLYNIFPPRYHLSKSYYIKSLQFQKLIAPFVPNKLSRFYGIVSLNQIDALIDISGFAFSDLWGTMPVKHFSALTDVYKRNNKAIILLPQAFGPFDKKETRNYFRRVIKNTDLIYARDSESYKSIINLSPQMDKVHIAPDITLFFPRHHQSKIDPQKANYCCIVPNMQIFRNTEINTNHIYFKFLLAIGKEIANSSLPIRILVHDSKGTDLQLANLLLDLYKTEKNQIRDVKIIENSDPIELKKFIGESLMIFGSRYHALISAFSQSVPSLCLGWAPKYGQLYEEFDMSDFIISEQSPIENVLAKVQELLHYPNNARYRRHINNRLKDMHSSNEEMWNNVVRTLSRRSGKDINI